MVTNYARFLSAMRCTVFSLSLPVMCAADSETYPSECLGIASSLERLTCFDRLFATPSLLRESAAESETTAQRLPTMLALAYKAERSRPKGDFNLLSQTSIDHRAAGQKRVMLTAPALGALPPRPLLMISCINNITRLQIGLDQSLSEHRIRVTLELDDQSNGGDHVWQVMESRRIVDAGRGIPSINVLKRMVRYERLKIRSDAQALDGLVFDIIGLRQLLPEFRQACHW